ncbi:MAG: hypothetical protein IKT22_00720, partial [Prevotella sp.]|nr:hypothetical protein [Prevotella sp.]
VSDGGRKAIVKYKNIAKDFFITDENNQEVDFEVISDDEISFATTEGASYSFRYDPNHVLTNCDEIVDDLVKSGMDTRIFDLQGRPTTAHQKGVYITDGRKYVVK